MLEIVTVWLPIPVSHHHPHSHHLPNRNLVPRAHRARWKFRVSRAQLPRPKDQTEHYLLLHWTPWRWYWKASLDWGQRWWNSDQSKLHSTLKHCKPFNFLSSMRGGNTDTPMMLDFCLRFPWCINELLKRVTGTSYRYFTNPVASYYLQPTLGDVDINFCDLAKLPKPLSGCLSKKQLDEICQWVQQYGKSVGQNTTRNFSTKDKPGTLPLNLHESAPRSNIQLTLTCFSMKTSPFNTKIPAQHVTLSSPSLRML